jgi:hypothetical protein
MATHLAQPTGSRRRTMEQVFNVAIFALFAALWAGVAFLLVTNPGAVDSFWAWVGDQHLVVQGVIWLLLLPIMAGMWLWETDWHVVARIVLVAGIGFFNLYLFWPFRSAA